MWCVVCGEWVGLIKQHVSEVMAMVVHVQHGQRGWVLQCIKWYSFVDGFRLPVETIEERRLMPPVSDTEARSTAPNKIN